MRSLRLSRRYSTLRSLAKCDRSSRLRRRASRSNRVAAAKKTLAIYRGRFIFTPVFVVGRRSVQSGNNGIAGRRISKGPRAHGPQRQVKKLMSLEEEPPSSASADPCLIPKPSPARPTLNGHGFSPPVQLARAAGARFVIGATSNEFRKRHFAGVKAAEWNDWRWQNRNRVRSLEQLERMIDVTPAERDAIVRHHGPLPVGVTPYYMSLIDPHDPAQGLRRTTIPTLSEFDRSPGEQDDPLGEDGHSPTPGLVHRYPDRVLLLVTNFCSVYCRYCTRARLVGASGERALRKGDIDARHRLHRAHAGDSRLPDLGRRPAVARRGPARVRALAPARDPAPRVHPDRHEAAGRAADARDADAHEDAAPLSPAVDEPALHASGRGHARGRGGVRPARRRRHSARQPDRAAQGASTTTSRR